MPASPVLSRGVARAFDLVLHIGLLEAAGRISTVLPGPVLHPSEDILFSVDVAVGLTALFVGPALAEWIGGATLGKWLLGLRVVSQESDERFTLGRAVTRNVALVVDVLFFGLVAYTAMGRSPLRQRVGDVWGRTIVVPRAEAPELQAGRGAALGVVVPFGLLLGSYILAA